MVNAFINKLSLFVVLTLLIQCSSKPSPQQASTPHTELDSVILMSVIEPTAKTKRVLIKKNIIMKDYFSFMDSLARTTLNPSDSLWNEYILVNANAWIIDSLGQLDYYKQKANGFFVYDPSTQIIFHAGDRLEIPDSATSASIKEKLKSTRIEVNIPQFRLWVVEGGDTLFTCPVRIGRNTRVYLEYYQREVDLRTPIGKGEIIKIRKDPKYIDLKTGEEFKETNRDDGRRTKMPMIPTLEPQINGKRLGTLIHATTNPESLGKIYSHGCIGTSESDMWKIYYHAPLGTKVNFRYQLHIHGSDGELIKLKDVYQLQAK
jgi:L,D-transpeptidase ErfK/SrfK